MTTENKKITRARTEAERQQALYGPEWLTPEQAGKEFADVSADTILAAIHGGELQAKIVSKPESKTVRYKIRRDWLDAFSDARMVNRAA